MEVNTKDGKYGAPFPDGVPANFVFLQKAKGRAEIHENFGDFFYVLEGEAEFKLNGELVNKIAHPTNKNPGEYLGDDIVGGDIKKVVAGDVLWIPPGQPHMMFNMTGRAVFLIVKLPKQ